jgi:hypothetical protein
MTRTVLLLAVAVALIIAACQTYDFEPVTPLTLAQTTQTKTVTAKAYKPNVMLLVDKSGSMASPIDPSGPNCTPGCGPLSDCPAGCKTRISELRSAMSTFLTRSGTAARLGLTFFPAGGKCEAPLLVDVPLPPPTADDSGADAALAANAAAIGERVAKAPPNGGTPTAASLAFVGSTPGLNEADYRDDFVILLTDGLPNCNQANANNICQCSGSCQAQREACRCTLTNCTGTNPEITWCSGGCLDLDVTRQQVQTLALKGIKTIVVGFGADTAAGDAATALNAMALAGGYPRDCTKNGTDADCGGIAGSCNTTTKLCSTAFYQAANAEQLAKALADISASLGGELCRFVLTAQPTDPKLLSVIVDGADVPAGADTWSYTGGAVVFAPSGAACTLIRASTPQNPVTVEIRIVETL